MSTANGRTATRATEKGLPLSIDSISANSSRFASSRSATFQISCPRWEVDILLHGPSSKARRAAVTARSTSSASASGTWATTSPVAGLYTGKVLPDAARTKRPSISMRCCREKNSAVLEAIRESTGMVAIKYLRRDQQQVERGALPPSDAEGTIAPGQNGSPVDRREDGVCCSQAVPAPDFQPGGAGFISFRMFSSNS